MGHVEKTGNRWEVRERKVRHRWRRQENIWEEIETRVCCRTKRQEIYGESWNNECGAGGEDMKHKGSAGEECEADGEDGKRVEEQEMTVWDRRRRQEIYGKS